MIEFVWPQTTGEWLAWISALYLLLSGLMMFVVPGRLLSLAMGQNSIADSTRVALMRGPLAGGYFGLGLAVLVLHPQPLLYLGLGSTLLFGAIARVASNLIDGANSRFNWSIIFVEGLLAYFAIGYALGLTN